MNKIKHIMLGILKAIYKDLKSGYDSMDKPKQIINILFWLAIIQIYLGKSFHFFITMGLYFVVYIWKVIRQGDWKNEMRKNYLK